MGLLDALDESIATVEAEHQEKGSPTTATLASTAAAPPASCGTYERTDTKDTYRCAANGFYLYKRSPNSWCVGKEPGGASCKCYQSKKGWQFYVSKKWTLRADVSLTWDDATGSSTDPSVPAAEPTADAEKPQTARVQGGMLADDDDATSSSGDDDEEVEVAAAPVAPPAKTPAPTAEPAKKKTSDAFGLAYTPYEVYDAAPARDAESSDDESDAESATAAPANSPPVASQATGDAPDLPSDKVRSLDSAPPPKNANNGKPRAGAKAPPPAHVAQDRPPPAEAKAPPASAPAPPAATPAPPADKDTFKAFDPAVLARTVAAYRAPVAAAPDSNEDAWASIKPPEQEEAEEPASNEPITYDEALRYFQGLDMSSDKEKITPTQPDQRHVLKRIFKRRPDLKAPDAERDFVFLVALQKYDPRVPVHWRMIHTVFRELTPKNKPVPCPTLGAHWVRIGFQGNDPRTDINRAMRCLALLQLLHLLEKERRLAGALFRAANQGGMYQCGSASPDAMGLRLAPIAVMACWWDLHRLDAIDATASSRAGKDWPFACTSISFTRMAVQKLRSGKLNARCNALGGVLEALHECHAALFRDFLARIRSGQDRFCALNDIQEGKKPIKVAKPRKPAAARAPVAEPPATFAALGGLPDDPSSQSSSGAALGRRYLVT